MRNRSMRTRVLRMAAVVLGGVYLLAAETPNGFAIYSKGDDKNRTLYRRELTTSGVGAETKICNKGGSGGDIQGVISFDGTWLAFSRSTGCAGGSYGGDDYHDFDCWDVYIVSLSGSLPATPKKVAHGYWPSWGDDSHNSTKTLYYSTGDNSEGTVRAVTVSSSGGLSNDRLVCDILPAIDAAPDVWPSRFEGFVMAGPTGEWCALRYWGNIRILHWAGPLAGQMVGGNGGCMPSVCADGKWIVNAHNARQRYDGSHSGSIGGDGSGDYHYGSSADMKWFVARTEGGYQVQNDGRSVHLFKLTATSTSFSTEKQDLLTDQGSWPDVHAGSGGSVPQDVSIDNFWADPETITEGNSSTLNWSVSNATSVKLDGTEVSGTSTTVSPTTTTEYTLTAEGENGPVSATVTVTVSSPELATIEIAPTSATISLDESVDFTATTLDQSGNDFAAEVSWSVDGGGSLSASSGATTTFTSDGTAGEYILTAQSGTIQATAQITVTDPSALHLKINCGENTQDVDGWERDDNYMSNGSDFTFSNTFSTDGVANAAPAGVYKSVVHYSSSGTSHYYDFPSLPNGTYTVRMHFSDGMGGNRSMNYKFEGTEMISDLDVDDEAGGTDKALVKEVTVSVEDGNGLQIECYGTGDSDVFEAGIEILGGSAGPTKTITVSSEYTGQTYDVGEVLVISWTASSDVTGVVIEVSPDGGMTWLPITGSNDIQPSDPEWGAYEWTIPSEIDGVSLRSEQAVLRVMGYTDPDAEGHSGIFTIHEPPTAMGGSSRHAANRGLRVHALRSGGIRMAVNTGERYRIEILDLMGRALYRRSGTGPAQMLWSGAPAAGTYILRAQLGRSVLQRQILTR